MLCIQSVSQVNAGKSSSLFQCFPFLSFNIFVKSSRISYMLWLYQSSRSTNHQTHPIYCFFFRLILNQNITTSILPLLTFLLTLPCPPCPGSSQICGLFSYIYIKINIKIQPTELVLCCLYAYVSGLAEPIREIILGNDLLLLSPQMLIPCSSSSVGSVLWNFTAFI